MKKLIEHWQTVFLYSAVGITLIILGAWTVGRDLNGILPFYVAFIGLAAYLWRGNHPPSSP